MNEYQAHALVILQALIRGKSFPKGEELFLGLMHQKPDWRKRPEEWEEGWTKGWAFSLRQGLHEAVDLRLGSYTRSVLDDRGRPLMKPDSEGRLQEVKEKYMSWAQGSAFAFAAGDLLYSMASLTNSPWKNEPGLEALQVTRAVKAVPSYTKTHTLDGIVKAGEELSKELAKVNPQGHPYSIQYKKRKNKDTDEKEDITVIRIQVPRDPGQVEASYYKVDESRTMRKISTIKVSQDDFVRLLITGEMP